MHFLPPAREPKSQLAAEQPSAGGRWNPPKKDTACPRTKEKPQQDGRRVQARYPLGGRPTNWRTLMPKKFSHSCEGSRLHIRLPSLGIPREPDFEGLQNLILGPPQDWRKNRDSTLGGHKHRTRLDPPGSCLEWGWGWMRSSVIHCIGVIGPGTPACPFLSRLLRVTPLCICPLPHRAAASNWHLPWCPVLHLLSQTSAMPSVGQCPLGSPGHGTLVTSSGEALLSGVPGASGALPQFESC